jgi:hypothetical protein
MKVSRTWTVNPMGMGTSCNFMSTTGSFIATMVQFVNLLC